MANGAPKEFTEFKFWCQKVLPLVYDDSLSYYEVLCKVVAYLNDMVGGGLPVLSEQISANTEDINNLKNELDIINKEMEKIANGDYVSLYINSLATWIDGNLKSMVSKIVNYVFFGITDDGHFAAYVPDTWDFIRFDTNVDPQSENYGHLYLYY